MEDAQQEAIDSFYFKHGQCCAGCDWWRSINSRVGECRKRAPVAGPDRIAFANITACSLHLKAGHIMTSIDHVCGDFRDQFDWASLPLAYLARLRAKADGE